MYPVCKCVSKNVSIFLSLYPIMHQPSRYIKIHQDTSRLQTPHRESETASATDRQICNIKFGILTDVPSTQPAQRVGRAAVPVATVGRASGTSVYPRPCRALSAPTNSHVGEICWKCARNARNFDRTFNTRALSGHQGYSLHCACAAAPYH